MLEVVPSTLWHVWFISQNMRSADKDECHQYGLTPFKGVLTGYLNGESRTVIHGKTPIAIFGIFDDIDNKDNGIIWLLGTDNIKIFNKNFLRGSKKELKTLLGPYKTASNFILKQNSVHIRWCKWLGATIEHYNSKFNTLTFRR